ncbi:hypothetical protein MTR67_001929 [Solanum verrucosum]|uniref:Uncharacterized protein n=1 Tax=Solanum verrucosum TaxID=315347 RepID=A0AAF0T8A5_SOLVR|nr:hypothetical protein MTR67_001929 [Solanum verrucosum]
MLIFWDDPTDEASYITSDLVISIFGLNVYPVPSPFWCLYLHCNSDINRHWQLGSYAILYGISNDLLCGMGFSAYTLTVPFFGACVVVSFKIIEVFLSWSGLVCLSVEVSTLLFCIGHSDPGVPCEGISLNGSKLSIHQLNMPVLAFGSHSAYLSSLGILCVVRLRLDLSSFFPPPNVGFCSLVVAIGSLGEGVKEVWVMMMGDRFSFYTCCYLCLNVNSEVEVTSALLRCLWSGKIQHFPRSATKEWSLLSLLKIADVWNLPAKIVSLALECVVFFYRFSFLVQMCMFFDDPVDEIPCVERTKLGKILKWGLPALHVTLPFIPLLAAIGSYKAVNSSFHGAIAYRAVNYSFHGVPVFCTFALRFL